MAVWRTRCPPSPSPPQLQEWLACATTCLACGPIHTHFAHLYLEGQRAATLAYPSSTLLHLLLTSPPLLKLSSNSHRGYQASRRPLRDLLLTLYISRAVSRHREVMSVSGKKATIDSTCFVAPSANVLGEVKMDKRSSIWYGAIVMGTPPPLRPLFQGSQPRSIKTHIHL